MPVRVLTDLMDILHTSSAFIQAAVLLVTLVPVYLNPTSSLNVLEHDCHLYLCARTLIFCAPSGRSGISFSVERKSGADIFSIALFPVLVLFKITVFHVFLPHHQRQNQCSAGA